MSEDEKTKKPYFGGIKKVEFEEDSDSFDEELFDIFNLEASAV